MKKCLQCKTQTDNPKFCSRSCAATYTNKKYPKRRTKKKCIVCGNKVKSYRHNRCSKHWDEYKENKYQNKSVGEYRNKLSVKGKHPSWIHAHVRNFARSWLKHLTNRPCFNCGYDKHVELCHIISISEFPDETKLGDINSEDNVVPLCRNCHWEFDNGIITI